MRLYGVVLVLFSIGLVACGSQYPPNEISESLHETSSTCSYGAITLDDDLEIRSGVSCTLDGTRVMGNIKLNPHSRLRATGVYVDGSIQAEGANQVTVLDSQVIGNIQIKQGGGANVRRTFIDGSLQLEANKRQLYAFRNTVKGNLQAFQNTGGIEITRNTIDGNLQCKSNNPAPIGRNNIVKGNKEDQCRNL